MQKTPEGVVWPVTVALMPERRMDLESFSGVKCVRIGMA